MLWLHFNKANGIFSARGADRSTLLSSERHASVPAVGDTIELAPRVHAVITRGLYTEALRGNRPLIPVLVTRFPKVRLLSKYIKEVF